MKPNTCFWSYLAHLFLEWDVSDKDYRKNRILCWITFFFRESPLLFINVEKYCTVRQATDDNMAYAHCMLGN